MSFIDQKKQVSDNMKSFNFHKTDEFEKEFKKLFKKYKSLEGDLKSFEEVLCKFPTGLGNSFTIIHFQENLKIVKARLACKSLREKSLRIIYSFTENNLTFLYLEIYAKNNKENEDRERIDDYLRNL